MEQKLTHQDFLTSHTLSSSRLNTKKDIFQKHQDQNQKLSAPMNCQQTHNALKIQKNVAVYFEDVKTEETFSSQDQKLMITTNL